MLLIYLIVGMTTFLWLTNQYFNMDRERSERAAVLNLIPLCFMWLMVWDK
jgi:hypothetical protein